MEEYIMSVGAILTYGAGMAAMGALISEGYHVYRRKRHAERLEQREIFVESVSPTGEVTRLDLEKILKY